MSVGASRRTASGQSRESRDAESEPRRRGSRTGRAPAGSPPGSPTDARIIEEYIDLSWMERGLADATLSAYRSDLSYFSRWLAQRGLELHAARRHDVLEFISQHAHWPPRTIARRLSAFRRFYQFLERDGRIGDNPCDRIDAPRLGRPLPGVLSEGDVERLLEAPDVNTALGLRDRAMLEVLYATGLRVSELVGAAYRAGEPPAGRDTGRRKGRSGAARSARRARGRVDRDVSRARPRRDSRREAKPGPVSHLTRRIHDPAGVLASDQALRRARGYHAGRLAPHVATRVCHAPARSRRGSSRGPDAPWTPRHLDDTNLYPRGA